MDSARRHPSLGDNASPFRPRPFPFALAIRPPLASALRPPPSSARPASGLVPARPRHAASHTRNARQQAP